jgi:hypothetical protein
MVTYRGTIMVPSPTSKAQKHGLKGLKEVRYTLDFKA